MDNILPETSHKLEEHKELRGILLRFSNYEDKLQFLRDCNGCFGSTPRIDDPGKEVRIL